MYLPKNKASVDVEKYHGEKRYKDNEFPDGTHKNLAATNRLVWHLAKMKHLRNNATYGEPEKSNHDQKIAQVKQPVVELPIKNWAASFLKNFAFIRVCVNNAPYNCSENNDNN